jgi:hypothetical protein
VNQAQEPENEVDDPLGVRGPERGMLTGFLDWHRQVVVNKVDGLSLEQASTVLTPTGLSPLGIVKHLADVEVGWFREMFAGEEVGEEIPHEDSFQIDPGRIVGATSSLDTLSSRSHEILGHVSLRWVLIHMLEETARHAGHLDLMRERLDGRTGD